MDSAYGSGKFVLKNMISSSQPCSGLLRELTLVTFTGPEDLATRNYVDNVLDRTKHQRRSHFLLLG